MNKLFNSKLTSYKNKSGVYLLKIKENYYVGSSINLIKRLESHKSKLKLLKHENIYIQRCFNKYGKKECFFSILEFCEPDIRLIKEQFWINTLNPKLNLKPNCLTQQNCITTSKPVFQYSLNGEFIAEFPSVREAERILGISGIGNVARKVKSYFKSVGGFLWDYEKKTNLSYTNNSKKAKIKAVTMYNKEGIKIKSFESIADAARYILKPEDNFDGLCACISSVAKNKGILVKDKYRYSYDNLEFLKPLVLKRNYPILQCDTSGNIIKEWESAIIAAESLNISTGAIRLALKGKIKLCKNSIWKIKM